MRSGKREKTASTGQNSYIKVASHARLRPDGFPNLAALLNISEEQTKFSTPITLDGIEMLEAELSNQGFLPSSSGARPISSHAINTANHLRWKAQRVEFDPDRLQFLVDLPRYLAHFAQILTERERRTNGSDAELLINPLENVSNRLTEIEWRAYIENFARYFLTQQEFEANRYERGLNLVLRIVAQSAPPSTMGNKKKITIVLPIQPKEFGKILTNYHQEDSAIGQTIQKKEKKESWVSRFRFTHHS